jgi:hypothetical protein
MATKQVRPRSSISKRVEAALLPFLAAPFRLVTRQMDGSFANHPVEVPDGDRQSTKFSITCT